jgi:hypothetical protein
MSDAPVTISVGLLSHTNAGKTTLARTLVRRDIGEVGDRAHVTELAERHVMIESTRGDVLALWDTPGFGDSMRLYQRLNQSKNPLGWALTQVWDRFTDRPFWSGQQAIRSAQNECDVLLYVVNASETPEEARYVEVELRILEWIGKPVLLVLNQVGVPQSEARAAADMALWRAHLADKRCVRGVLTLDAFARCWVQEDALLAQICELLHESQRAAAARLRAAWRARNRDVFQRSMQVLAHQLANTAMDQELVAEPDVQKRIRDWASSIATGNDRSAAEVERAQKAMAARLETVNQLAMDKLIELHGLSGRAATQSLQDFARALAVERPADAHKATLLGGLLSGAAGGLAADLAVGGLSFGAGALIGGILGALGGRGAAEVFNVARGRETGRMHWSAEFMNARVAAVLLTYLAVAHFGRGRGDFVSGSVPDHWQRALAALGSQREALEACWEIARSSSADLEKTAAQLTPLLADMARQVLIALYPDSARSALAEG